MKSTHVCHIATMTQWGGVERILIDFLCHADRTEVTHSLLATSSCPEIVLPVQQAGVPIFQPSRRFHYDPAAILQMAWWLRSREVQVVHAYNAVGNAWGNLAGLLARTPVFISGEHGSVWRIGSLMYWLNRAAYQRAQCVIANSEASKILVCYRYQVNRAKVKVVHNIVAPPATVNRQVSRNELGVADEFVVGSIGRLSKSKGYTVFADAAKQVLRARSNVKFVLIGGGDQEADLKRYVQDLGIEHQFILTGWRSDARELLSAFDIFVSTSIHEAFGNVLVEAARVGVPVIAPCVDGIPEAVSDGVTGKLIRPVDAISDTRGLPSHVVIDGALSRPLAVDPSELAHAILELITNHDMRRCYGEAGKRHTRSMCTVEKYTSEIHRVYAGLLSV